MNKQLIYREATGEIDALLSGITDPITRMSSICAVLKSRIPWTSWVGFYRVVEPGMLEVGPYQGGIGCLRIPFDRGVCGAAARTLSTQIVPDVNAFPGHIVCDTDARSEIVVPVLDSAGRLFGVLDLDSRLPAAFDEIDGHHLEQIALRVPAPAAEHRAPTPP